MTHLSVAGMPVEHYNQVWRIANAALRAADPRDAVRWSCKLDDNTLVVKGQALDLNRFKRIRVVGAGKASRAMVLGLLDVLGERLSGGVIISKHSSSAKDLPERIHELIGGHPVPDEQSVASTRALVQFIEDGQEDDLLFFLISGGGSALMTLPVDGVTLEDMQKLTRLLLGCGATINEMNTLRKHLDRIKGGGLARAASPARLVSFVLSDVIGSPLDVIASGPAVADPTTYADALEILKKYQIETETPDSIVSHLKRGICGDAAETLKPGDTALAGVTQLVVASNQQAAEAALDQARKEGFHTLLLTTFLQGEAAQAGGMLAAILQQIHATGQPLARPACIVVGGETTVTLRGDGLGGRNQELALGAAFPLAGLPNVALLTLGTDGEDGPTDAAGAIVTGETIARAQSAGLDARAFLDRNDSYHFFEALGDLIRPGATGTNVNDLAVLMAF